MRKRYINEYHEVDIIIDDIEGGYFFHLQDKQYAYKDYEYEGYDELIYLDFIGKAKKGNEFLKIDKDTKIIVSITFSEYLGTNDRIGMIEKNKSCNELTVSIGLPLNSRNKFMELQSVKCFKSISILTHSMKYNKAIITSFTIRTTMPPED